jgi:hypothetical protein
VRIVRIVPWRWCPFCPFRQLAKTLAEELGKFRVKINMASATESFEAWRERYHDDLVLAVALAAWAGEWALRHEYLECVTEHVSTYKT